jgi:radical SAM protein with 4Fe4S-binding SPASM domain
MKQEAPFAIQIEPTEGCTLACSFCALQSIRDNGANADKGVHGDGKGPYKFMTVETAQRIAREIHRLKWNPRIELAMHGEPTMNPKLAEIVGVLRSFLPRRSIMVTTNGSGITKPDRLLRLFNAGANTVAIDDYKHAFFVARIRQWLTPKWLEDEQIECWDYPQDKVSPHGRFDGHRIIFIRDITDNTDGTHKLTNQGGNSFTGYVEPLKKRCAKPFRELSIRWDGNVALCCDDWPGNYKIANVNETPMDVLWNHHRFTAARQALYHGRRDLIGPCSGCNVITYRNGLLPDKMGKQRLPEPGPSAKRNIKEAEQGMPFTTKMFGRERD